MTINKKTIVLSLGIFAAMVAAIAIVYFVRGTGTTVTPTASATPKAISKITPTAAPIFEVGAASCDLSFEIPCTTSSPTATPSGSPSVSPSVSPSPSVGTANLDCLYKKVYKDDSRNRAGFYYLENEITDTASLVDGQTMVYSVGTKNYGTLSASDVVITDVLSSSLTYVDADNGCSYEASSRKVTCTIGALAGGVETARSIRVRIGAASSTSIENTAEVYSTNGQRDTCSLRVDVAGKVIVPSPTPRATTTTTTTTLPRAGVFEVTASTLGAGVIFLILGAIGLLAL